MQILITVRDRGNGHSWSHDFYGLLTVDLDHPEGAVAEMLGNHQQAYPDVAMGSYPTLKDNRPCTQLVLRSIDADRLAKATDELKKQLAGQGFI